MQRQSPNKKCQICQNDAEFTCSNCKNTFYCSEEHQRYDWKFHKNNCGKLLLKKNDKQQQDKIRTKNKRKQLRKQYYLNFCVQKYDRCLQNCNSLVKFQENNLEGSYDIFDEFQHGASVCLLIRTLILLREKFDAKIKLNNYLKNNKILGITRNLPHRDKKQKFGKTQFQFFSKKLSLISTLANLSYELNLSCISLYILYTQNIEFVYGQQSLQVSNCYFLIGCYYAEEHHFIKAIACFKKAASLRNLEAGDCYFNLGILYKWLGRYSRSLQMFQKAAQRRSQQYGEYTKKVADVYQCMGIVYMQQLNYKAAIQRFQMAYKIRNSDQSHPDFKRLSVLLNFVYQKLQQYYLQNGFIKVNNNSHNSPLLKKTKSNLYQNKNQKDLKNYIQQREKQALKPNIQNLKNKEQIQKQKLDQKQNQKIQLTEAEKVFQVKITPDFVSKLSPFETYHLSELQLQLQHCKTQYRAAVISNQSKFVKSLDQVRLKTFRNDNPHIFGQLYISNILPTKKID